jgi:hypothetical protein
MRSDEQLWVFLPIAAVARANGRRIAVRSSGPLFAMSAVTEVRYECTAENTRATDELSNGADAPDGLCYRVGAPRLMWTLHATSCCFCVDAWTDTDRV